MAILSSAAQAILSPADVAQLLVLPMERESIPGRVGTTMAMSGPSLRVPVVQSDPSAGWVLEGSEIAASDAVFSEVTAAAKKVAGLTVISRELAADSSPDAAEQVGAGLARDLRRKVDAAFIGDGTDPATPAGLASLTNVTNIAVAGGWANADPFVDAVAAAAGVGASLTHWLVSASDYTSLRKLKTATGSNQSLITPDAGGGITIEGLPVIVSPDLAAGVAYGLDSSRIVFGLREDAEVVTDSSAYFSSDRVGVRATLRATFAFPHEESIVKLTVGA